jgi:catechol 2,3-dioxygenase-like lactoylglutathione lyase family enzyme
MIRTINHIGISVENLERSIDFYRRGFGMEVVVETRFKGERYERILALTGAEGKVALLKAGSLQIELFEFSCPFPGASVPQRPVCDHGITHFCIEVQDIEAEYKRLMQAGATFHSSPLVFGATIKATYGRDPDGNIFELMQVTE